MITFIINPSSGGGRSKGIWKKLERYLVEQNIIYKAFITKGIGDAKKISYEVSSKNQETEQIIVAIGGDGTVNEVLEGAVISSNLILACIPTGTGNDLARGLKLPKNPIECLKKILSEDAYTIDYGILRFGDIEHRRFLVSSGIGFDAEIAYKLSELRKKSKNRKSIFNRFYYIRIGLKQFLNRKLLKGYIIIEGDKKVEFNNIVFISAHNHPYEGGGFMFAPDAKNSDGKLSICIVHEKSKLRLALILISSIFGKHKESPGVRVYNSDEIKVFLEEPIRVHLDGEDCGLQKEIEWNCIKRQLRFIY